MCLCSRRCRCPNSSGCTTDATYAPLIAANPAGFYVNVHNGDFPAGAIRGQLANAQQSTVLLPIPLRAYDSRTGDGPLAAGATRTIGLANGKDAAGTSMLAVPPGASAALVTLTVTQTVGAGFVTLYSAAITSSRRRAASTGRHRTRSCPSAHPSRWTLRVG